jgi:ankyrin repeat protein
MKRRGLWVAMAALLVAAAPGDAPVADAAEQGDLEEIRALVRAGADVNAAQGDGMTALHWAAQRKDLPMAELLIQAGANVEATTRLSGHRPLHLASAEGSAELVHALLQAGADAKAATTTGVSAIHLAAESGAVDAIRALTAAGADVNTPDGYSARTPLMFAVAHDRIDAARALLDAGADVALTSQVVDYAARADKDRAERSRRNRMLDAARPAADSARPGAAERAQQNTGGGGRPVERPAAAPAEQRERALSYEQLVGKQGGLGALHFAARDGRIEATKLLLDRGAAIDQPTAGDQSTPLVVATINGNFDLARMLLDRGADPNLASEDGVAPLFATINHEWNLRTWYPQPTAGRQQSTSYLDLMKALLDKGADPNARLKQHLWHAAYNTGRMGVDFQGVTAFWRAAYSLDLAAMKLLVAHGADPHIPSTKPPGESRGEDDGPSDGPRADRSGLPPAKNGDPSVTALHAATGVGYGTSRVGQQHRHVPEGWLPAVRYLVDELGLDVNARDHEGYSAVHHAASRGDNAVILFLVERGADVNAVSRRGQTTIDMANGPQQRVQPFPETIRLLESLGATNSNRCLSC